MNTWSACCYLLQGTVLHFGLYFRILTSLLCFLNFFIYSLFNDAFSVSHTLQLLMKGLQINDELERMWKEAAVA
jgi:hypothetical protein